MNYSLLSDEELMVKLNQSDNHAFKEVYDRYWQMLYNHARRMLKSDLEAADVVQDVFTNMLTSMGRIKFASTLPAYLVQSIRNKIINMFHHDQVKAKYIQSIKHYLDHESNATDASIRDSQMAAIIQQEIDALPPKMREVFNLSKRAYLSNKEIAEAMDISETTVKKHLRVAMQKLRIRLGMAILLHLMSAILWINRS